MITAQPRAQHAYTLFVQRLAHRQQQVASLAERFLTPLSLAFVWSQRQRTYYVRCVFEMMEQVLWRVLVEIEQFNANYTRKLKIPDIIYRRYRRLNRNNFFY